MARRRSEEDIEQVLERYRGSGLTQIEYCRRTGMVLSTLGRYLRRNRPQQLVKVELKSSAEAATGFALVLGNGRRIESGWGYGEAELVRLIRIAESV
jgi:DNA-binding transcriptional regulator LsrR (DeoR family)